MLNRTPIGCCTNKEHTWEFHLILLKAEQCCPSKNMTCRHLEKTYKTISSSPQKFSILTCTAHIASNMKYPNFNRCVVPNRPPTHRCMGICYLSTMKIYGNEVCFQSTDPTTRSEGKYGFVVKHSELLCISDANKNNITFETTSNEFHTMLMKKCLEKKMLSPPEGIKGTSKYLHL